MRAAADIPASYAARVPQPCTSSTLLIMSADCKGIVTRPGALRAATAKAAAKLEKMRTRLAAGEKPNRKRMPCLAALYDAEPAKRRPHDVIAPPGGRHGDRELPPGPKARARWPAGSVRNDPAEVIAAMYDEAEARDPARLRTWVVLVDGAKHQLDLIRAEAARRGVTIHIIIDIIHVLEYIWGASWCFHEAGDPAAEDWGAVKALAILAGDSTRAAQEITARPTPPGWPAAGEPGPTHASISGSKWGLDGAEAVLTLRAVISNGDISDYWRFHLEREHQRLYSDTKQEQYALGA